MLDTIARNRTWTGFVVAAASALAVAAASLVMAPPASAVNACAGQTFNTVATSSTCLVAAGETVAFTIQTGAGGDGADFGSFTGGSGGLGARVTGTYTNTSNAQETVTVYVGVYGLAGSLPSTQPTSATDDSISVGSTVIAYVTGGGGATNSTGSANGTNGTAGALTVPASLPSGWTATTQGGLPSISFSAPTPPAPTPTYPPGAPTSVTASAGDAQATVQWAAPASVGSFPISHYLVTSSPSNRTCLAAAPALTCDITGLTNGTAYTFTVEALNGAGWGADSEPSNVVVPRADAGPSVTITGTREGKRIAVTGTTRGFGMGGTLRPWVRFAGQTSFAQGTVTILVNMDGTFDWSRRTGKRASVYVATPDGSVRSNTVTIAAR